MTGEMTMPRVLLVDDRPENLLALEAVLEPLPCALDSVSSGDEALKALLNNDYAVILLDVQMPGMDGFETAELMKGRERNRTVPIIFVTAISKERQNVFRGYATGAVDYVFKPYDPVILRSKVAVFLELDAKTRAAESNEAIMRAAFDSAPVGIARLDMEGRIADANQSLCALLGQDVALLRDRLIEALWHPDDVGIDADRREALLSGRIARYDHEVRFLDGAGDPIPCLATFRLAELRSGGTAGIVVGVQDLRERRRAEAERELLIREQASREHAERLADRLAAIQRITDVSLRASSFEQLVKDLLLRTAEVLGADSAAIVLDAEDRVYQLAPGMVVESRHGSGDEPLAGVASVCSAPLSGDGGKFGSLHVGTVFARTFTATDAAMLRLAAERAGQAITRVRLFEREHAIAEELQRSLLPDRLPVVPGVATAARYFAAGPGSQVGGDWYDVLDQPEGRLLLVAGDVAGRGMKAASAMGQLRSALRAYAYDGHSPGALLDRMNMFLAEMRPRGMATLLLVLVDHERGEVRYAKAGHPPALLVAPGGGSHWLSDATGPPLGAVDDAIFTEGTADLGPGSTLVLYTDGLVEQRGEPLDRGLERLRAAVADAPEQVDELVDHVVQRALSNPEVDDDVTVLVLRTASVGPEALLPGATEAPSLARAHVRGRLEGLLSENRLAEVSLAVSELVTNAFLHGGAKGREAVRLRIDESSAGIRFSVADPANGSAAPVLRPLDPEKPGGMGLQIVDALADEWGIRDDPATEVWFRIATNGT